MSADLTYSAGPPEPCWHERISRFDFPRGQKLYRRDWKCVVSDLAGDYHDNHDGWESSWPLEIRIYEGGNELARFTVEREYVPVFTAWAAPNPAEGDGT